MKTTYRAPALTLLLGAWALAAQAQQPWQPFRPGLMYSFSTPPTNNLVPNIFLLRLDSAYVTAAGDSAWAFNRLLRPLNNNAPMLFTGGRKSRNNLFGARLIRLAGTGEFVLENVAEGASQTAISLRLRPRTAVGGTWVASTVPALTATLTSRTWQAVTGTAGSPMDSVATITFSSGAILRLSKQFGLLAGPRWLDVSSPAPQWQASALPATSVNSPFYPTSLFSFQPGDRLGYATTPRSVGSPPCNTYYRLRIIQTRQLTADSLVYTYRQQTRTVDYGTAGCTGPAGASNGPVTTGRLAFSLRNGRSPHYDALALLSGEYRTYANLAQYGVLIEGLGLKPAAGSASCWGSASPTLQFQQTVPTASGTYTTIIDGNWNQTFSPALGDVSTNETNLTYYFRSTTGGPVTCGSALDYATLLPTRAATAAAVATLHPNPAPEATTLTLAQPARFGATLRLTDALGRTVWSGPVTAGQTTATVPLAGQPAGLYLLHLQQPEAAGVTWKLLHQ